MLYAFAIHKVSSYTAYPVGKDPPMMHECCKMLCHGLMG
ncbi:hypothetical protein LINPERHAP1_LOCUS40951 [Linum perenne]